jgi:DNA helicase II / ATP-dependent DNA helicase PcrA
MDAWRDIRLKARECHRQALSKSKDRKACKLIAAALEPDDLQVDHYEPGSVVSKGVYGFLDRESKMINVASGQSTENEAVVIAHELGHFKLHRDPRNEVTALAPGLGGDPIDSGAGRVEGYSPRERKEVQADVFAGEFLCPSDWLREELLAKGRKPRDIAAGLGLPPGLVMNQAVRALLLPPLQAPPESGPSPAYALDASQLEAATWNAGPLLVDAGPGTGKTRTLVHRIRHLLENGGTSVPSPASILALTFSNKAAEEMRERLSAYNADAAIEMWVGTFHAFGLELITKYHQRIGRSINVRILDEAGSLALLEENLIRLPLRYFQNLYEPAYELVNVLRAISRCKDELITPAAYRTAAEAARVAAITEDEREVAGKALEVAAIYEIYEDALKKADAVDFGDLVLLSAHILEQNTDIRREYQNRFKHILVDEYQDVNSASARLLRALSRPGADVWVVADQRQSIYRFRGAAPTDVQRFPAEFSGARRSLAVNYRSGSPVVRAFQSFAASMQASPGGGSLTAQRGNVGAIRQVVAPSVGAEAAAIRDHIEQARAHGIPYSEQVILARSHLTLARITGALEKLGVPLLYLGDLFEREEIRDLLSLLSIGAEPGGIGLVRVAQLQEYGAAKDDALAVIRWAEANNLPKLDALRRVAEIPGLTAKGQTGLACLAAQLEGVGPGTSPWMLLTAWLFERSAYLTTVLVANDSKSQQKLIAIYQFLKVCGEMAADGNSTRKYLLARVRRIEALNDDRIYRAVASEASDTQGVRVLTIHGSKGLEFKAVHLPALATRYMPAVRQGVRCPPPPSLAHLAVQPGDHDAEEECLFFVALSRARDFLFLTRSERYTATQNASASRFLSGLNGLAPVRRSDAGAPPTQPARPLCPPKPRNLYQERELSLYIQCPQRYQFETLDGLRAMRDEAPYIRFHRCVFRTIGWLEEQRAAGTPADRAAALEQLAQEWALRGPTGHGFEAYYRASADSMVTSMVDVIAAETGTYDRGEWIVDLDGRQIAVTPDRVVIGQDGTVHLQRIRTGRKTKSDPANRIYALLRRGAETRYRGKRISIETYYLATDETVIVPPGKDDKLLAEYRNAITEIERGAFAPAPEDARRCPNCQCYFICDFIPGVS